MNPITISEVGPRDGLQSVETVMSTADKMTWIEIEYQAGVREIEVGSFVSPTVLPQMADTAVVVGGARRFKDLVVASIKVVGHIAALTALFGAICSTVAWILNGSGMTIGVEMIGVFDYLYTLPVDAMSAFLGMLGLGFVDVIIGNFMNLDLTGSEVTGYNPESAVAVGWEFAQVVLILAKLYVVLAFYHFFWGVLNTFFNWIKSPYLPFKSS